MIGLIRILVLSFQIANGGFEDPRISSNTGAFSPRAIPGWTLSGAPIWLLNNAWKGGRGPAPRGQQILAVGTVATPVDVRQPIGRVQPATLYTLEIDVYPNYNDDPSPTYVSDGVVMLAIQDRDDNEVPYPAGRSVRFRTLRRSSWHRITIRFDSGMDPRWNGMDLYAWLRTTKGSAAFDRVRVTVERETRPAYWPIPAQNAARVSRDVVLQWTPCPRVASTNGHILYLDTDERRVRGGSVPAIVLSASQYAPGRLQLGQRYYWRVDQRTDTGAVIPGMVWSFVVDDGRAYNPDPPVGAELVSPLRLRWSAGGYTGSAGRQVVYFGTSENDVRNGHSLVYHGKKTEFDPGVLTPGRTYYLRVDQEMGREVFPGEIWKYVAFDPAGHGFPYHHGYAVWVADSLQTVFPASRPATFPRNSEIALDLGRNEYESAQIVILPAPGRSLHNVRLEPSDLVGPGRIDARHVEWRQVGYLYMTPGGYAQMRGREKLLDPGRPSTATGGWWPDLLLPVREFDVADGHAQPVWVTVLAPEGAPPGLYRGSVRILTDSGYRTDVPVRVNVRAVTLPKGPGQHRVLFTLYEDLMASRGMTHDEYLAYGDYYLRHRVNPDNIYRNSVPKTADLERFLARGMNTFTILRDNYSPPMRESPNTIGDFWSLLSLSPAARRLARMARVYGFDEADGPRWPLMGKQFGYVKTGWPQIRTMTTAHVYDPRRNPRWAADPVGEMEQYSIDDIVVSRKHASFAEGERIRRDSRGTRGYWMYHDSTALHSLPVELRAIGWQIFHLQVDGFLHFATNAWYLATDRLDPARGPFYRLTGSHGDRWNFMAELVFPGTKGTPIIGTIRLARIRDGLEDALYLRMVAQRRGRKVALAISENVCGKTGKTPTLDPTVVGLRREEVLGRLAGP